MPSALRSFAAWIAIACLAFGSLLPLASLAATKTATMAICSTSASTAWQSPGSTPNQSPHTHCSYCSNGQPYVPNLPGSNVDAFRATSAYLTAQTLQHEYFPQVSRADNRARAPPI